MLVGCTLSTFCQDNRLMGDKAFVCTLTIKLVVENKNRYAR